MNEKPSEYFHGFQSTDVRRAASGVLENALCDEARKRRKNGQNIRDCFASSLAAPKYADDLKLFPVADRLIRGIDGVWGIEAYRVFREMGIGSEENPYSSPQAKALFRLFMNIIGYDFGIGEIWLTELESARKATGKPLPACPIRIRGNPFRNYAKELIHHHFGDDGLIPHEFVKS